MDKIQSTDELEKWHQKKDPWAYENSSQDRKRKNILLGELPRKDYKRVLDIGCGQGFITRDLPGKKIIGMDISKNAVKKAKKYVRKKNIKFIQGSIFELDRIFKESFDLIVITGVLYPQYIGNSNNLIYLLVDRVLEENGNLTSVHIDDWYTSRFPYLLSNKYIYEYREYIHRLEVYTK